jgi:hypothetical protein
VVEALLGAVEFAQHKSRCALEANGTDDARFACFSFS